MHHKQFPSENWQRLVSEERQSFQNVELFLEHARPAAGEVWLDYGCGPGYFTLPLANQVKKIFAADISPEMLEICRQRAEEKGLRNIEYIRIERSKLPLKKHSVNKVVMANVFHELDRPENDLQELNRVATDDALIYLIDWRPLETGVGPPLHHRRSEEDVKHAFETAGFRLRDKWDIYDYHYFLIFQK